MKNKGASDLTADKAGLLCKWLDVPLSSVESLKDEDLADYFTKATDPSQIRSGKICAWSFGLFGLLFLGAPGAVIAVATSYKIYQDSVRNAESNEILRQDLNYVDVSAERSPSPKRPGLNR